MYSPQYFTHDRSGDRIKPVPSVPQMKAERPTVEALEAQQQALIGEVTELEARLLAARQRQDELLDAFAADESVKNRRARAELMGESSNGLLPEQQTELDQTAAEIKGAERAIASRHRELDSVNQEIEVEQIRLETIEVLEPLVSEYNETLNRLVELRNQISQSANQYRVEQLKSECLVADNKYRIAFLPSKRKLFWPREQRF